MIASYNRRFNFKRKEQAVQQFKLAQMVASYVSRMFSNENDSFPDIWDYYPDLFEDERRQVEEQRAKVQLELHKQRMRLFAERTRGKFTSAD